MAISNITNKLISGREATYGTLSPALTSDWGIVESFSYNESESVEQVGGIGGGYGANFNEGGLYSISGSLTTKVTKSALPELLEAFFGSRTDSGVPLVYAIVPNEANIISYSVETNFDKLNKAQLTGLVFTTLEISASKDGFVTVSCDYIAKEVKILVGQVVQTFTTAAPLSWLDISGTYNGQVLIGNDFTFSFDWNIDAAEGRGLESVAVGERRLIQRVIKNSLNTEGSIDVLIQDNIASSFVGYNDELTEATLSMVMSRGLDNAHTINLVNCVLDNKNLDLNAEGGLKNFTADVKGRDVNFSGDL